MRRFEFRLQRVLDLAGRSEEAARRAAAEALAELRRAEDAERTARTRVEATLFEISTRLSGGSIEPGALKLLQSCLVREQEHVATRAGETSLAASRHRELHEVMIEKRRELLALERARENAWETWRAESEKNELHEIEDVTAGRTVRRILEE